MSGLAEDSMACQVRLRASALLFNETNGEIGETKCNEGRMAFLFSFLFFFILSSFLSTFLFCLSPYLLFIPVFSVNLNHLLPPTLIYFFLICHLHFLCVCFLSAFFQSSYFLLLVSLSHSFLFYIFISLLFSFISLHPFFSSL